MTTIHQHKTFFISDLHLDETTPSITHTFLQFLQDCDETVDALYILGDFFESWIGDDDDTPFHRKIILALKAATQKKMPIYFMHGNRDFLIGKNFLRETGCQLLADEEIINIYGTPVLLMHGDTLCTRDTAYINARKWMRHRLVQTLFLRLPLAWRKKIANNMRQKSMQHTQSTPTDMMDVTQIEVERVMQKHNVAFLIHGHTHRPRFHDFLLQGQPASRIVLAAWHDGGSALKWNFSGKKELITL